MLMYADTDATLVIEASGDLLGEDKFVQVVVC